MTDLTPDLDPTDLLATLPGRDLSEHVEVFERVHDALAERLAGAEG